MRASPHRPWPHSDDRSQQPRLWLLRTLGLVLLLAGSSACASASDRADRSVPTAIGVPSPPPLPAARVRFTAQAPPGTLDDARLSVVILDEVSGYAFNAAELEMQPAPDGTWRLETTLPAGALIRYHYRRAAPTPEVERSALGDPLEARVLLVDGSMEVVDLIAAWSDSAQPPGTGVLRGVIEHAAQSTPLEEQIVVAAGQWTFTDELGEFELSGVPAGLQRLTVFSPDGRYLPKQQGAVVQEGARTPVVLSLTAAQLVQVTFEVTVPEDTLPGAHLRIAGNLQQFGHRFSILSGLSLRPSLDMPTMTMVDGTHYLWITELPAGTYLRYKYTLGDGVWNAERTADGAFNLRQMLIPESDLMVRDTVASWRGDHASALFRVVVPPETPSQDTVAIQFNPKSGLSPLPMTRIGDNTWFYVLYGPLDFTAPLTYRYCRNLDCQLAGERGETDAESLERQVSLERGGTAVEDRVEGWRWWRGSIEAPAVIAPQISTREGYEAGVELMVGYRPEWKPWIYSTLEDLAARGSSAVILTPGWVVRGPNPRPSLRFDPSVSPYREELLAIIRAAQGHGLTVSLRPSLQWTQGSASEWWAGAPRDQRWWEAWYSGYSSFALSYAELAAESGAAKLILGGSNTAPAYPEGSLADGSAAGTPPDASVRWRTMLAEIRRRYSGRLALELEVSESFREPPDFLRLFDEVHLHWRPPLGGEDAGAIGTLRSETAGWLDLVLAHPALERMPVVLSVAYPSITGGTAGCPAAGSGGCLDDPAASANELESGDLAEQALVFNAVLLESYDRPIVRGFFARGYNPVVALQDPSSSVHGKPAAEVLWYWFPRITGRASSR